MRDTGGEFDDLLRDWVAGDEDAAARVWELVYDELRHLAGDKLQRLPPGQTLQSTALVHEAWLRLSTCATSWRNRAHFFGAAARAMRNILVDRARRRDCERHGGALRRVPLTGVEVAEFDGEEDVLELDAALVRLGTADPRAAQIVDLRYFAGLTIAETATVLDVSHATVEREWTWAKAWLRTEIAREREALDSRSAAAGTNENGRPKSSGAPLSTNTPAADSRADATPDPADRNDSHGSDTPRAPRDRRDERAG